MLPDIGTDFQRDTRSQAWFYFNNGFVEVSKGGLKLLPYSVLSKKIWLEQVIDREFEALNLDDQDWQSETEYYQFIYNIAGQKLVRLTSILSAFGYLLHGYKDPSNPKVVVLVDETISDKPSGGTGKGLVFQAIKRMQPTEVLDGKTFDFKDKFAMQNVSETTRLVVFEDWDGRRLPFDKLFNMTTNELKINRLYLGQVSIPFDKSPKFAITTNDMVGGEGESYARRKFEIEIAPHYSGTVTPFSEFGHNFFNDWNKEEWNRFDNLMLTSVQLFLNRGLEAAGSININRRKLLQATSIAGKHTVFARLLDGKLKKEDGSWVFNIMDFPKAELWLEFLDSEGLKEHDFTQRRFNDWVKLYAYYEEIEVDTERVKRNFIGKPERYFQFKIPVTLPAT